MGMCTEVDLSNKDKVVSVLKFLKSQLPQSILAWQLLTYIHQNIVPREDIYAQLFVDHPTDIKCVIILYSTPGLVPHANAIHNYTRNVAIIRDQQCTTDDLIEMLTKYVPWKQRLNVCDSDPEYVTPVIEQFVQQNKIGKCETSTEIRYELNKEVFLEKSKILPSIVPEGIEIRPLKLEDAPLMIEAWGYKSCDLYSVAQVRFCIEKLCALGAYCDGKLVCWRILQYDGSLDMNFTMPEARRLGLSAVLSVRLATEMFKMQERVFGYAARNNRKALGLAAKIGFYETGMSDWIEFEPTDVYVHRETHPHMLKSSI